MGRYVVTSPIPGYVGEVGGVRFEDGRATVGELGAGARLYFGRHGWDVEEVDDPAPSDTDPDPSDTPPDTDPPPSDTPSDTPTDGPQATKPAGRSRTRKKGDA